MHITNIMTKLDDFNHQAKIELSCGNEFQAQRQLVNIRELLMNELPYGELATPNTAKSSKPRKDI